LKKIKDEPDENLKNCLIKMIEKSMESQNILEIKKLLLNSIGYYKDGKIKKISNDKYEIRGNHGKYLVSKQNNDYICECPMYKKNGKYSNAGKQKCSHVQTVELFECVCEEKNKNADNNADADEEANAKGGDNNNIFLLSGEPGAGKSYCVDKILNEYGDNSVSFVVMDNVEDGKRISFNLVIKEGKKIIKTKTFAKKTYSDGFDVRIGSWYVNPMVFEKYAVPIINDIIEKIGRLDNSNNSDKFLFVIDELGKMQSTSKSYVDAIERLFRTIDNSKNKNFTGIFVVPTSNSKWIGLDKLKDKYLSFDIKQKTREKNQLEFVQMVLGEK
jgi:nucleoside-triphosphatase THEP1